jgi:single-strand DNA-binding protein
MINATITGRVGQPPELKTIAGGRQLVTLSVASSNRKDSTTWVRCTIWREQLGQFVMDKVTKGARVCVAGMLEEQAWGDNGDKKSLDLDCTTVELYDWPEAEAPSPPPKARPAPRSTAQAEESPF